MVMPPLLRLGDRGFAGVRELVAVRRQALVDLTAAPRLRVAAELGDVGLASLPHAEVAAAGASWTAGPPGPPPPSVGWAIAAPVRAKKAARAKAMVLGVISLDLPTERRRPVCETEPAPEGS